MIPFGIDLGNLTISLASAVVASLSFLYAWRIDRPRIIGQINTVLYGGLETRDNEGELTAIIVHLTLTNSGRYPVYLQARALARKGSLFCRRSS